MVCVSFFSRENKRNMGGRGRRPNVSRQEGRNKRTRVSNHLDVNSKEFKQLIQSSCIYLGGQPSYHHLLFKIMSHFNYIPTPWTFLSLLHIPHIMDVIIIICNLLQALSIGPKVVEMPLLHLLLIMLFLLSLTLPTFSIELANNLFLPT